MGLGFASAHGYTEMNPYGFGGVRSVPRLPKDEPYRLSDGCIADSVTGALQAQGGLGAAEVAGEAEEVAAEAGAVVEDAVEP